MRRPLIAANWKMHMVPSEARRWVESFLAGLDSRPELPVEIAICAPATHLAPLGSLLMGSPVALGAQDVSAHHEGAYTGEVSAAMLQDLGVRYVIVGHSERRAYHQEADALVRAKLKAVLAHGMRPILCVGESLEEREAGRAMQVVMAQLAADLEGIVPAEPDDLVIAYEPIWAIGTGKTASTQDAQTMCAAIRAALESVVGTRFLGSRILYGGSMKRENALELMVQADIDGGLVGSASLEVDSFLDIVGASAEATRV